MTGDQWEEAIRATLDKWFKADWAVADFSYGEDGGYDYTRKPYPYEIDQFIKDVREEVSDE